MPSSAGNLQRISKEIAAKLQAFQSRLLLRHRRCVMNDPPASRARDPARKSFAHVDLPAISATAEGHTRLEGSSTHHKTNKPHGDDYGHDCQHAGFSARHGRTVPEQRAGS